MSAETTSWRAWCAQRPDGTLDRSVGPRPFPAAAWKGIAVEKFGVDGRDRDAVREVRDQAKRAGWRVVPIEMDVRETRYGGAWEPQAFQAWRMGEGG